MFKIIKLSVIVLMVVALTGCCCEEEQQQESDDSFQPYSDKPRITSESKVIAYEDELIVMRVTASDMNVEDLDYYIKGEDSKYFTINRQTGEIQFRVVPNYEDNTIYNIIVGAKDFSRNTGEMHVTITLSTDKKPIDEAINNGITEDFTLRVTVDQTKSNGTTWDMLGGAPDIRILIDGIVHDGKCQDSFKCDFQFSSTKSQWVIKVVDQDISLHDTIGEKKCSIGVNVLEQAIVDIIQN